MKTSLTIFKISFLFLLFFQGTLFVGTSDEIPTDTPTSGVCLIGTVGEFTQFLCDNAKEDHYDFYQEEMATDPTIGNIYREGELGAYHYFCNKADQNKPIHYTSALSQAYFFKWAYAHQDLMQHSPYSVIPMKDPFDDPAAAATDQYSIKMISNSTLLRVPIDSSWQGVVTTENQQSGNSFKEVWENGSDKIMIEIASAFLALSLGYSCGRSCVWRYNEAERTGASQEYDTHGIPSRNNTSSVGGERPLDNPYNKSCVTTSQESDGFTTFPTGINSRIPFSDSTDSQRHTLEDNEVSDPFREDGRSNGSRSIKPKPGESGSSSTESMDSLESNNTVETVEWPQAGKSTGI